jgi:hypothetical protein
MKETNLVQVSSDIVGGNHAFALLAVEQRDGHYWLLISNPWMKSALVSMSTIVPHMNKDKARWQDIATGFEYCKLETDNRYKVSKKRYGVTFWIELHKFMSYVSVCLA